MPVINLELRGKQAISDGTKIVCMNGDYDVRIKCSDCAGFEDLPVKKLIVKSGFDYTEVTIEEIDDGHKTYLQAGLPVIESQTMIELGVCGKETEDGDPVYTSKAATFECEKSILCGALILKKDPVLKSLEVEYNGTYRAEWDEADGYYEVEVNVPAAATESRTENLDLSSGNQVILPSDGKSMSAVTIVKPTSLVPGNIRAGYDVAGVVGTFDKILTETTVYADGEYAPPEGYDGFSKVTVNVNAATYNKFMYVGNSFSCSYTSGVSVTVDTPDVVRYSNSGKSVVFTAIQPGSCSVIVQDLDEKSAVVNTIHYAIVVEVESDKLLPVEVDTVEGMETYLETGAVGGIIQYTGVTVGVFEQDALYIIKEGD